MREGHCAPMVVLRRELRDFGFGLNVPRRGKVNGAFGRKRVFEVMVGVPIRERAVTIQDTVTFLPFLHPSSHKEAVCVYLTFRHALSQPLRWQWWDLGLVMSIGRVAAVWEMRVRRERHV